MRLCPISQCATHSGVGEVVVTMGDAHIYLNHIEQVKLQLTREPRPLSKLIYEA